MEHHARHNEKVALEIVERSPYIAARVAAPPDGGRWKTLFISQNIGALGYESEQFYSGEMSYQDIIHPEDYDGVVAAMERYRREGVDQYTLEYRVVTKAGETLFISDSCFVNRDEKGNVLHNDCVVWDNSKIMRAMARIEDNLRQQGVLNDILQSLHATDPEAAFEIILSRTGAYLGNSRALLFRDTPDHTRSEAVYEWCGAGIPPLKQPDYAVEYEKDIPEVERGLEEAGFVLVEAGGVPPGSAAEFAREQVLASAVFAVMLPEGRYGFICFDECEKPRGWSDDEVAFLSTIARLVSTALIRIQSAEAIERMAYRDQLTGLTNRYRFDAYLEQAIRKARQLNGQGYVLFTDMDDFKIINDGYGHDYGDALLVEMARYFEEEFGDAAELFRFGGDEFVILLGAERSGRVQSIINAILTRAQNPWPVLDKKFYCTVSIGVVRFPSEGTSVKEIIQNADIAMYQAKKQGKNNYVYFNPNLDTDILARAETEHRMRQAIENNFAGFEVYYQPLVNINGSVKGAEALIRWLDKDGKQMLPSFFIELAEYLGLIIPLGEYVLRTSALECKRINERLPDFSVSVNVSMRQFQQSDFVKKVRGVLDETGVNPRNIIIEVTEGLAVYDLQQMKRTLGLLRGMGIRIALDDFGTGYSSLNNMREIPLDIIKIDRSFVIDIADDDYSKTFVRLITDLCHSMERSVCIEGVETREQLRYCMQYGADYIQGFYFWKPMPSEDLQMLLMDENASPLEL